MKSIIAILFAAAAVSAQTPQIQVSNPNGTPLSPLSVTMTVQQNCITTAICTFTSSSSLLLSITTSGTVPIPLRVSSYVLGPDASVAPNWLQVTLLNGGSSPATPNFVNLFGNTGLMTANVASDSGIVTISSPTFGVEPVTILVYMQTSCTGNCPTVTKPIIRYLVVTGGGTGAPTPNPVQFTLSGDDLQIGGGSLSGLYCSNAFLSVTDNPSGNVSSTYSIATQNATPAPSNWLTVRSSSGGTVTSDSQSDLFIVCGNSAGLTPGATYFGNVNLTYSNGNQTNMVSVTFDVPLAISPSPLPTATVGQAYNQTLTATGSSPPYAFAQEGTWPSWLSLSSTGNLSGTPPTTGPVSVIAQVNDIGTLYGVQVLNFSVNSAVTCTYSLSSNGGTYAATASTSNSFTVTAQPSTCAWTAMVSSQSPWITLTSASGTGSGSVDFNLSANTSTNPQTGTITVGGQTFTVTQQGAPSPCTYSLSPAFANVGADAGNGSFAVTTQTGCSWTALVQAGVTWLTTTSSGSGSGTAGYSFLANGPALRTATISVGGQTFTVTQAAANVNPICTYTLSPSTVILPSSTTPGGSFTVTAPSGCAWTASTTTSWISTFSAGSGSGSVAYTVNANNGSVTTRVGSITVGTATFSIGQPGNPPSSTTLNYNLPSTGNCSSSFFKVLASLPNGLLPTEDEGAYGLVVSVNNGLLAGGFNLGGGFDANGGTPGYGNFQPANSTTVTVSITAVTSSNTPWAQPLMATLLGPTKQLLQTVTQVPPFSFTTPTLSANTFYTVQVNSLANAPEGAYTMSLATAGGLGGFTGGVATGGKAIQGFFGYGAFCLPVSQNVQVVEQIGSMFGPFGAGNLSVVVQNGSTTYPPH